MRTLNHIIPHPNFTIDCLFDNGVKKTVDLKDILLLPVFKVLQNQSLFVKLTNKKYFIEWSDLELDLSADTLYQL